MTESRLGSLTSWGHVLPEGKGKGPLEPTAQLMLGCAISYRPPQLPHKAPTWPYCHHLVVGWFYTEPAIHGVLSPSGLYTVMLVVTLNALPSR